MVSERAHNGLYEIVQLVIADARRTYQVPHLATKFVVFLSEHINSTLATCAASAGIVIG